MSTENRSLQERVRAFVDDELVPHEVEAEMNGGVLPDEVERCHKKKVRELATITSSTE